MFKKNVTLLILAILIVGWPLVARVASEYQGTDSQAQSVVEAIDPDYQPWFSSLIVLPGSEIESLLFALQAALGAGVLGFALGRMTARPKQATHDPVTPTALPAETTSDSTLETPC